jgi:hypothetical protein
MVERRERVVSLRDPLDANWLRWGGGYKSYQAPKLQPRVQLTGHTDTVDDVTFNPYAVDQVPTRPLCFEPRYVRKCSSFTGAEVETTHG